MASGAQIDYDALAKQHGAIDYDSMAQENGAVGSTEPAESPEAFRARVRQALPDVSEQMINSVVKNPQLYKNQLPKDFDVPQPEQHRGFISHVVDYAKSMTPEQPQTLGEAAKMALAPLDPRNSVAGQLIKGATGTAPQAYFGARERGHGVPYSVAAGVSTQVGVRPEEMEKAAEQGDTAGVLGEAAVPTAMAVTPLVAEGAIKGGAALAEKSGPVRQKIAEAVAGPVVRKTPTQAANDLKFGRNPAAAITREPGLEGLTTEGLRDGVQHRMQEIGQVMDQTLSNPQAMAHTIDIEPIINKAVSDAKSSSMAKLNPGLKDRIDALGENLKTQFGDLKKNPLDATKMKRDIGSATKWTGQPFDNEANQMLVDVYRGIKNEVNTKVPEVKGFNERYADLLSARAALDRHIAFDTNRPLSMGRAILGAGGGALGAMTGGALGGAEGAGIGLAVDALRSNPSRIAIGKMLGDKYPMPEAPSPQTPTPAVGVRGGSAPAAGLPPRAVAQGIKGTNFKYMGRSSSMGISELKDPATGISISILDKDLDPAKIKDKIAAKLQEFGQ